MSIGSGKLLLAIASIVILASESRGTHGHILMSHDSRCRAARPLNYASVTTPIYESEIMFCQREATGDFIIKTMEKHIKT